jgi:two-component system chemotaxis response regulator CheB
MSGRDIIVVGTSAGGVAALERLVEDLPKNLGAAVFFAIHIPRAVGVVQILKHKARLPVHLAANHERLMLGKIYVAPGKKQLSVENGVVRVEPSPPESPFQPSINALFRSAATSYGPRVIGVVLTGMMYDGSAGLWEIKEHGGVTIVQDPADAEYPEMPEAAIGSVAVDYVLPLEKIGEKLVDLTQAPRRSTRPHGHGGSMMASRFRGQP